MRYNYIFLLLIFNLYCKGQNYTSIRYTMDNGLPQNSVKDIVKDKYGFIWITTENNVLRYDGEKLETYKNSSLSNSHLGDFYGSVENDSVIVFGDLHGKKLLLNNKTLQNFENSGISRNATDSKNKGFSIFNKTSFEGLYFNNKRDYFIAVTDGKYFFTNGSQIAYEGNGVRKTLDIPYVNLRNAFAFDNILLIRNLEEKKLFAIQKGEPLEISAPEILFDSDSKIHWQQTTGQVFIVRKDQLYIGSFSNNQLSFKLLINNDAVSEPFHCIFYDKDFNKLYIGSLTKGLNIITPSAFRNVPEDYVAYASLPYNYNTVVAPNGKVLGKRGVVSKLQFPYQEGNTFLMMYDDDKNIWYARMSSLVKLLKSTNYQKSEEVSFGTSKIEILINAEHLTAVALTDNNNGSFLNLYNNVQFEKPVLQFRFTEQVTSVCFTDRDNLLVGTTDKLYSVSLKDRKVKKIHDKISVKHIIKNNDGTYWITTKSQGFFLLKSSKLIAIPPDRDNALLAAHYILDDSHGYLWISSNNGLFKTSKKEIENFLANSSEKPHYYRYDIGNGLLNNELNGGSLPNAYQLDNKDFVFPSFSGFLIFNPQEVKSYYPKKGELFVERMRVNNGEIESFNKVIRLESDFKHLEILLDIPYYGTDRNLQLSVKQDNQEDWKDLKQDRKLDVFNLKPGKHKFTFRIYTDSGYDYKTVTLEVVPFFYETNVFYLIITVLASLVMLWIIYYRTRRLSGKNETLTKQLATESDYQKKLMETISHDITTPLKFISDLSQRIMESDDPEVQRKYFDSIHKSSEELYKFTSEMKHYAQLFKSSDTLELCNIYDIVEEKRLLFDQIAKQKNVVISNNIPSAVSLKTIRNTLSVIIHNILDNAIKNSGSNIIEIKVDTNDSEKLTISVWDFGVGMSDGQIEHYNNLASIKSNEQVNLKSMKLGLNLVIQLIRKLDGNILFKRNTPKGTQVDIILKINSNEKSTNN